MFDPAVFWIATILVVVVAALIGMEVGLSIREDWDDHDKTCTCINDDEVTT